MDQLALGLVLAAAGLHAGWNLLAKRVSERLLFLWLVLATGSVLYAPAALATAWRHPLPAVGLPFILLSGVVHSAYYRALARMYAYDFSLTYPVARGSGPVFVAVASLVLLREPLTPGGLGGIALVVVGIGFLHFQASPGTWAPLRGAAGRLALRTGVLIACYSLVDKTGVAHVHPVLYLWSSHLVALALAAPAFLRQLPAARTVAARWPQELLACAVAQNLAYILVLFAMRLAPVAYVLPARELSTLIGVLLARGVLREAAPRWRVLGAVLIVAGVVLISTKG